MRTVIFTLLMALAFICQLAAADTVVIKNGDTITGTITAMKDAKLSIKTEYAGVISIKMAQIKTFTANTPLTVVLKDGTKLCASSAAAAGESQVQLSLSPTDKPCDEDATALIGPQTIKFSEIEEINPPPVKWTGSLSVGAEASRGNTINESVNVSFKIERNTKKDRIKLGGSYDYGRKKDRDTGDKETTKDKWELSGKYDYFFSKHLFGYANSKANKDRLSDLDLRFTPGVGVGYQWIRSDDLNFGTEAGASWVYEKQRTDEPSEDYIAARAAYNFDMKLLENVTFFHNFEYIPSLEDSQMYLINTDAGVKVKLNSYLSTELKADLKHNSDPAEDADHTDIKYTASIGLEF